MLHESTHAAAERRLRYELGLRNIELEIALPDFRYRAEKDGVVENEICPVLIGFTNDTPTPNPSEVANVRWVDWNDFLTSLAEHEIELSPWAVEEARLLDDSNVFKIFFRKLVSAV
jgi:isopentenyl-diphosphate delta-isomerase